MKPDHKKRRSKKRKKGCCKAHEKRRRNGGKALKSRFKAMLKAAEGFLKGHPGYRQIKCALVSRIMVKGYDCSIRGMVEGYNSRPGLSKKAGLGRTPSRSWPHKRMGLIPMDPLDAPVLFTAGKMARRTLIVDSSHHTYSRYVGASDPKKGTYYKLDTVKHHALMTSSGRMVASIVTDGNTGDSPVPALLCAKAPHGRGYLLGDPAYCPTENCRLAVLLGRMPCLLPRKNCSGHGFSAWARMLKWHKEHPGSFYKAYGRRSLVESGFTAVKGHFGHAVRCVTLEMQRRELAITSICRNLFV